MDKSRSLHCELTESLITFYIVGILVFYTLFAMKWPQNQKRRFFYSFFPSNSQIHFTTTPYKQFKLIKRWMWALTYKIIMRKLEKKKRKQNKIVKNCLTNKRKLKIWWNAMNMNGFFIYFIHSYTCWWSFIVCWFG